MQPHLEVWGLGLPHTNFGGRYNAVHNSRKNHEEYQVHGYFSPGRVVTVPPLPMEHLAWIADPAFVS